MFLISDQRSIYFILENNAKKGYTITYRCEKCGAIRRNKMANDDDFDLLMKIVEENSFKF